MADPVHARGDLLVWGAHGGAGTSTLPVGVIPVSQPGRGRDDARRSVGSSSSLTRLMGT
ncbi:MAG TPA: hypothetical protein VF070_15715 [Streptosporangiaceae bacterium]